MFQIKKLVVERTFSFHEVAEFMNIKIEKLEESKDATEILNETLEVRIDNLNNQHAESLRKKDSLIAELQLTLEANMKLISELYSAIEVKNNDVISLKNEVRSLKNNPTQIERSNDSEIKKLQKKIDESKVIIETQKNEISVLSKSNGVKILVIFIYLLIY